VLVDGDDEVDELLGLLDDAEEDDDMLEELLAPEELLDLDEVFEFAALLDDAGADDDGPSLLEVAEDDPDDAADAAPDEVGVAGPDCADVRPGCGADDILYDA
jgi:hypothetical protein